MIATYCILLKEYPTLGDQLLHCITKMFYRISVKQSFDALFFQLSTLKLFSSIIVNRRQLPPCEATKELLQLIQHITRKFVNALSSNPLLGVEIFFGRTRHECRTLEMSAEELRELEAKKLADVSVHTPAAGTNEAHQTFPSLQATIKSDDEVEVKRSLKWSEQIGVAVAVLIDSDKAMLLKWLIQVRKSGASLAGFTVDLMDAWIPGTGRSGH